MKQGQPGACGAACGAAGSTGPELHRTRGGGEVDLWGTGTQALGRRWAGRVQGGDGGGSVFQECRRGTLIWHASREFAPRCEPHPARAKWSPMIRMGSGSSLAFQRLSRDTLPLILSVRLAVTRFPVVPSG
eukprot:gene25762-biopygen21015